LLIHFSSISETFSCYHFFFFFFFLFSWYASFPLARYWPRRGNVELALASPPGNTLLWCGTNNAESWDEGGRCARGGGGGEGADRGDFVWGHFRIGPLRRACQ
jgi:hypothetical protein